MILFVAARPLEISSAAEIAIGLREALERDGRMTEEALLEEVGLAEAVSRARVVCLFDARGAHAELVRVASLVRQRPLVWFVTKQTFHNVDRIAIYRRVAERAARIVYPSHEERVAVETVLGAFAEKTVLVDGALTAIREVCDTHEREPSAAPPIPFQRVLLWSHHIGLGDSVNLLAVAGALSGLGAQVTWAAPDRHLPLLEGQLAVVALRAHGSFDPAEARTHDLVLEITIRGADGWPGDVVDERWIHLTLDWQSSLATMHENMLAFLARAGLPVPARRPQLAVSAAAGERARRALDEAGISAREHLVLGVHPGAGHPSKRWLPERFAEVLARLRRRHAVRVVLVGGPDEDTILDAILATTSAELVSRGAPLPDVAALLARCTALLSNDSGLMHVAAALDTPTLGIFGPSSERIWAPAHPWRAVVAAARTPGAPMRAMSELDVDEVERAAETFLERIAYEPPADDALVVTQRGVVRNADVWESPSGAKITAPQQIVEDALVACGAPRAWGELEHDRGLLEALLAAGFIAPVWWAP